MLETIGAAAVSGLGVGVFIAAVLATIAVVSAIWTLVADATVVG